MLIGEVLAVSATSGSATTTATTPWIASWGNSAVFPFQIIDIFGPSASLTVKVFTKNTEDVDPGTQKGTTSTKTSAGTYSITDAAGLLELVRLEFALTVTSTDTWASAVARIRTMNPSWNTN